MGRYAAIAATGRYVPERVVTNAELDEMLGQPVGDWLVANVGIERRHVMGEDQATSDLAVAAGRQALERAGLGPEDLDLILVATDTPDFISPATSTVVQAKLGAGNAATFDLNCACAAFVTGLDTAAKYIMTDPDYDRILLIGAYGMTRYVDWTDKYTATLFADGAGAVVVAASEAPGFLAGTLASDGSYYDALGIFSGGTARPATPEEVAASGKPRVEFARKMPSTFNVDHWPALVRKAVAKAGLTPDDVDLFLFTQLNLRTIEAVMDELEQPRSKTHWIMDKWGYTGSACIPMALDDAVEQGKVRTGNIVVFCASGGGVSMAANVVRWTGTP